jgi:hypothetical protein
MTNTTVRYISTKDVETFIACNERRGVSRMLGLLELWVATLDENGNPSKISISEFVSQLHSSEAHAAFRTYLWFVSNK